MKINAKKDYDFKEDILYIFPKKREYDSSFQTDNFIFDLDKKGEIAGLEILNASNTLGVSKNFLLHAFRGLLYLEVKEKNIKIRLEISSKIRNKEQIKENNFTELYSGALKRSSLECAVA